MRENAKVYFDSLASAGSASQGRGKVPFESRNHALGLCSLAILEFGKMPEHLPSVLALGPTPMSAPVDLDDRAANAQRLATQNVVVFRIVGGVCQKPVDANPFARLSQDRAQQRGVVARPIAYDRVDQQMRRVVASQSQLRPARKAIAFLADFMGVVRRTVSRFQPRGIDAGFLPHANQALLFGVVEDCVQQSVEQTFFKRRCCAL
jgi:hypothetical protein